MLRQFITEISLLAVVFQGERKMIGKRETSAGLRDVFYYACTGIFVVLPNKVKRTRKIRGRNTMYCPGLTGLQQGEYR